MNHTDFKEARYLKEDWFSTFTLGHDDPGKKHWIDEGEKKLGCALGFTEHSVDYYINDWRYRGKLVPAIGAAAAFGCSYTFGYGVNKHWPGLLGAVNCGINGGSNDLIARLAITYCKTFNPGTIYVLWTFKERREHVQADGGLDKFRSLSEQAIKEESNNPTWASNYAMISSNNADDYNFKKNKMLLTSYCVVNNITLHQATIYDLPKEEFPLARDNDHPGDDWHTNIAGILVE
tara:strand:- start:264 stop:965 length:702 start_codon:yes stop_codon:yes gene_type:complete